MRVTLRWSISGHVLQEVECDAEDWGAIVRGDTDAWSSVPTRKLYVVRDDGIAPLEGLFLAAAAEVILPIYAKPASFHNALAGKEELPNGTRKWRKEFKQHVAETYYRVPAHWQETMAMTVQAQDFWILRMLQVWARETRCRFRPTIRQPDPCFAPEDLDWRFYGRYRHGVTELMADRFLIDDELAKEELLQLEAVNMEAHTTFTQFLWTDENRFHCFVL